MQLNHVGICVKDVERSIKFYRDALGLTLFQDETISGPEVDESLMVKDGKLRMVVFIDRAGTMIEIFSWINPVPKEKPAKYMNFTTTGILELCLTVDDMDEAEKRLVEKGYRFRSPLWNFGKGTDMFGGAYAKIRYLEDPDGIQVELMQIMA